MSTRTGTERGSKQLWTGKLLKALRTYCTASVLLCLTAVIAPQAIAQVCGPNITLNANQWRLVGVPCNPGANNTVSAVFGPSLNAANYGVTWILWKRVYDSAQSCPNATPNDCYTKLTLASTVSTGDAFWLYTTQQATLDYSSITQATPGTTFQFPAKVSANSNSRYYMFANPWNSTVSWANITFPSLLFGFIPVTLTAQQAVNNTFVSKNVHYWNGNTYFTRDLTTPVATFSPKESAWLEMLQPNGFFSNVNVRVPKP